MREAQLASRPPSAKVSGKERRSRFGSLLEFFEDEALMKRLRRKNIGKQGGWESSYLDFMVLDKSEPSHSSNLELLIINMNVDSVDCPGEKTKEELKSRQNAIQKF